MSRKRIGWLAQVRGDIKVGGATAEEMSRALGVHRRWYLGLEQRREPNTWATRLLWIYIKEFGFGPLLKRMEE